jgi:myo-inositol 2-dehydrogenase/D-chiro-inositol 1-dehydrogenase
MDRVARLSRRAFVQGLSVAAAGVATGLSVRRSAYAAGSDVLKLALVGCGGRGSGVIGNCFTADKGVRLLALADAFEERARGARERLKQQFADRVEVPDERIFVGLDAYQKAIHSGVDVVILTPPAGFRPLHYAAAIKAGKHVFMEKPCFADAAGFRAMQEANRLADEQNLKVGVGLQRRHDTRYIQGIQAIHDGELGRLLFLRAYWNAGGGPALGTRPENETELQYQIRRWQLFAWLGGDVYLDQHVANLDVCNWAQKAHPVEANGLGGRTSVQNYGDVFDHHCVEFTYADGVKLFSQCRQTTGCWNIMSEWTHGASGSANCQAGSAAKPGPNPSVEQQAALFGAIRNSEKHNEGWHGAEASMTAVLGRMASYSGQVVRWDEAVAKGPSEAPENLDRLAWDAKPHHLPDAAGNYAPPVPGVYRAY